MFIGKKVISYSLGRLMICSCSILRCSGLCFGRLSVSGIVGVVLVDVLICCYNWGKLGRVCSCISNVCCVGV